MQAPVDYWPDFVPNHEHVFAALRMLPWQRRIHARLECYFNDTPVIYTYGNGRGRRDYVPEPEWHPEIIRVRAMLEDRIAAKMDVCFCNQYVDQHESLGWHADDSPDMDDARPIVTVSFGAARDIWLRPRGRRGATVKQLLEPGSALIMLPGMQDTWDHRIPRHDRPCGPRISLTFRGYVSPHSNTSV